MPPDRVGAPVLPSIARLRNVALVAVLVVAWAVLEAWGLGSTPVYTKGEPREGLVMWEMLNGGGWVLPRVNGVEMTWKPPLFHWLGALTGLVQGELNEWSLRLPSALLSLVGVLAVFAAGAALWSSRAGLVAALVLLTAFEWARAATNSRVDMTLTVMLEIAFLGFLFFQRTHNPKWLPAFYIGMSLAVLAKGPVGVALPGATALIIVALTRDWAIWRQMRLAIGLLVVAVIAGSWYVLAWRVGGWEFLQLQLFTENIFRVLDMPTLEHGDPLGHRHSVFYLLGALALGFLPWTFFVPAAGAALWRQRRQIERTDPRLYFIVWIVVVFTVYAVAVSKRSVYVLALYPALALLLGEWWDAQSAEARADRGMPRWVPAIGSTLLVVPVLVATLTLLEMAGVPLGTSVERWFPAQGYARAVTDAFRTQAATALGCALALGAALLACRRAARIGRWPALALGVALATAAVIVVTRLVILPGIAEREGLRRFMAHVRHATRSANDLSFYRTTNYEAIYYWGARIPVYAGNSFDAAPRYLLLLRDEWGAAPAAMRTQYELVPFLDEDAIGEARRLVLIRRVRSQDSVPKP